MTKNTIKITRTKNCYRADLTSLPGSPPVGEGNDEESAILDLFTKLFHPMNKRYLSKIDTSESGFIVEKE